MADISDADIDAELMRPPPRASLSSAPETLSHEEMDRELMGHALSDASQAKPGDIDPLTGRPFQFLGAAGNSPVARSLGKPIYANPPGPVAQAAINLATDPEQRRRIAAAQLFPELTPAEAQSRVFYGPNNQLAAVDRNGNPFAVDPQPPSIAGRTVGNPLQWAASGAGAALPMAGGMAGGLIAGPGSLILGPTLSAAGAAGGDLARQGLARYLDPATTSVPINLAQTAKEALLSGGGALAGGLATRALAPNALRVTPAEVNMMRSQPVMAGTRGAYDRAAAQGVQLTPGQASNLPSLLQYEDAATTMPGTVDQATRFYREQGQQVARAGENMLSTISPNADKTDAALMFQQGAEDAVRGTRQQANALASDAYKRADETVMPPARAGQTVPILARGPATPAMDASRFKPYDLLGTPDGLSAYNGARASAAADGIRLPDLGELEKGATLPFQGWDYMKKVLQGQASEAARAGNNYKATQLTDMANGIKNEVVKVNPAYGEALDIVAPGHRLASRLEESALGRVSDMTGEERARGIVNPVFNQNPRAVAQARDAFEATGRLDEWHAGVRSYLQDAFDKASMSQQGLNPAMLRRQVWSNVDNRDSIRAALTPEQFQGFDNFLRTIEDTARTYPMNSLTATRQNARGALSSAGENQGNVRAVDAAATILSPFRWGDVGARALGGVRQSFVQGNVQRIVGHLFTPDGMQYLEAMARYSPGSQRAIEATSQAVTRAGSRILLGSGANDSSPPPSQTANPLVSAGMPPP